MANRSKDRAMSWGDVNFALYEFVRQGVIAGFRTNRGENAEPVIWVRPPEGEDAGAAIAAVRGKLTGVFANAEVRLDGET